MKAPNISFLVILFVQTVLSVAQAGTRAIVEIEVIEDKNVETHYEIINFDDKRARIDFVGPDQKVTKETPYVMTIDGGDTWVMGDKSKGKFYCSTMRTEEFFANLGGQVNNAIDFFNVKAESPVIKQTLEEPGPEILGYKTTHVQVETNAKAYAWFLFMKFEYSVKIVDDIWYTTEREIHPARQKWLTALTQSGNSIIDNMFSDYVSRLPGTILKTESVMEITNVRKNKTDTHKDRTTTISAEEVSQEEMDKIFIMPDCTPMDDDEIREKAKALFSAGKIML
jgi:hypothetical protein